MENEEKMMKNCILSIGECLDIIDKVDKKESFFYTFISKQNNLVENVIEDENVYDDEEFVYDSINLDLFKYCLVSDYYKYNLVSNKYFDKNIYECSTNDVLKKLFNQGVSLLDVFYISYEMNKLEQKEQELFNCCKLPNWDRYNYIEKEFKTVNLINWSDYFRTFVKKLDDNTNVLLWFDEIYGKNSILAKNMIMVLYNDFYKIMNYKECFKKLNDFNSVLNFNSTEELFNEIEENADFLNDMVNLLINVYKFNGEKEEEVLKVEPPEWLINDSVFNNIEFKKYLKHK